ncbi:MAG: methyltransferase domain-containing protein [Verrucomicrobia bacterium]|nr:methyltransferase domain-containing protein [Verrucomicrobiota bacterium]
MNPSLLICPVCSEPLAAHVKSYTCSNGHSFDTAKEGYLNLLLSHQRKSKNPGDDKAMILARRRFFDSGAFEPITKAIQHATSHLPHSTILDCGCGEGHFLGALSGTRFGVDVSKEAIRCAAKRYKDVTWIVANGMRDLPFTDHSLDVILSVLAPRNVEEFARTLKADGQLILGVPGPNHLIELRTLLTANASDFEEKADEAAEKCAPLFKEKNREALNYEVLLNKAQITDLIQMTPIFWNSSPEAKEEVQQLNELSVTISFVLLTLKQSDPTLHNPE